MKKELQLGALGAMGALGALSCEAPSSHTEVMGTPQFVAYARQPDPPTTIEPAPFSTCVSTLGSGVQEIEHDGQTRTFVLDVPESSEARGKTPLILAFHGWGGTPDQLENTTRIVSAARARGWTVARPLGINRSFDAGACCGVASETKVDDVGFARAIVATLARDACADPTRVYATGFSNGGFLAHRLGCEASDVFVAVASVAGTLGIERCAPTQPVSVLEIHGQVDGIVPFGGDSSKRWRSIASTIEQWTRVAHCTPDAAEEFYTRGSAHCVRNSDCEGGAEIALCRDDRAAHTWPGGPKSYGFGGSQDLDATEAILTFFARHAR